MSLFWDLYFPANERVVSRSRGVGINFCNWTLAVRMLDLTDSALRPALLALCLARIGESQNDRPVSQQAIKLYGTALKEMHVALQDQDRVQSDELLAAGKLMAGYEVFKSSGRLPEVRTERCRCFMAPLCQSWQLVALIGGTIPKALSGSWKSGVLAEVLLRTHIYFS